MILADKSYIINFTTQKILLFRAMETKGLRNCGNPCLDMEGASPSDKYRTIRGFDSAIKSAFVRAGFFYAIRMGFIVLRAEAV